EFTPAQNAQSWVTHYMHGGVTALISAGELHMPGLPTPPDARTAMALAHLAKRCWDNLRPSGVKVYAGTLLLVPGLSEDDFAALHAVGSRLVKFIFYDYGLLRSEEHTSELQSRFELVCRLLLEKKNESASFRSQRRR